LLFDPEDVEAISDNLVRALAERALVGHLAAGARESAQAWVSTPEEFARRLAELVDRARVAAVR
jgi:hypothetical protein